MRLGDTIEAALKRVGITEQRVTQMLGRPCGCAARRDRLNAWQAWAERVLAGEDVPPPGSPSRNPDKGGA